MSYSQVPAYPLDKNELGNASWKLLHSYAAQYPDKPKTEDKREFHTLLKAVVRTIPEGDCKCKSHAVEYIGKNHPKMGNRKDLVNWLCAFHNDVNQRSGKSTIDCSELLKKTGDCPSCKLEKIEKEIERRKESIIAADKDGPLKTVMGDYKKMSLKVFDELCKRENLPTPKIIFSPCPPPNQHTSCTTFLVNPDKSVVKQGYGREPIVYINPGNFGLRVLAHEFIEYERQMKHSGRHKPKDEDAVERRAREIIHKYFPADTYDYKNDQVIQPLVMKDERASQRFVKRDYSEGFGTNEFPMFEKYRNEARQSITESENEAAKSESGGLLSYFDPFYKPIADYLSISARDLNLANTPNIFAEGSKMALNTQLTAFGSLVASSLLGLALYVATGLNREGIGISDRRLLAQLGGQFIWSGLQTATSPMTKEIAAQVGSHIANMQWNEITPLLVKQGSIFAGITESQAQQQAGVQRRAQQRAAGTTGGRGGIGGGSSRSSPGINPATIERIQERAAGVQGPENIGFFKNFPSGAAGYGLGGPGQGVPRADSAGGAGFTYVPTPAPEYGIPQEYADYLAQMGMPAEATSSLPSTNLGLSLSPEELDELR